MPISSVIVRKAESAESDAIAQSIATLDGTTVKHQEGDSLVVLIDVATPTDEKHVWNSLEDLEGVAHVDLIYHNFEDVDE